MCRTVGRYTWYSYMEKLVLSDRGGGVGFFHGYYYFYGWRICVFMAGEFV